MITTNLGRLTLEDLRAAGRGPVGEEALPGVEPTPGGERAALLRSHFSGTRASVDEGLYAGEEIQIVEFRVMDGRLHVDGTFVEGGEVSQEDVYLPAEQVAVEVAEGHALYEALRRAG